MRDKGIFISSLLILICALIFIGGCSSSDSGSGNSTTYSISGTATLDGSALQGVTVTLSGAGSAITTTDASGNYIFENLPAGTYTVIPSLAGYNYSPSSPTVSIINANQTQNFTATSAVTSYSLSGTISYSGSHTGRIYVGLKTSSGGATGHGTSIASPGTFTIRGVAPGTYYKLSAEMDIRRDGTLNADNPSGEILTIQVTNANLTNQNITLTDPAAATPVTPGFRINPGNGVAMILWNDITSSYKTIAESYKIYWGTDTAATNRTPIVVQAKYNSYMQSIANGNYYYKISALVGNTESTPSAVVGPVPIGAGSGPNTVSGTVTIGVTPTGPLYVGLYFGYGIYYFTRIASPAASQAYSFSGVPNGAYRAFAFLDQNNDGSPGIGDAVFDYVGALPVVINNTNPTVNMTLSAPNASGFVGTQHWTNGSSSIYPLNFAASGITKLAVKANLASGQNISVPLDMQKANNSMGAFSCQINLGAVRPALTDSYRFDVTYADGSTEQMTAPVTAVLDSFVQNLIATNTTTPTFSWSAPASPPAFYSYYIAVYDSTTGNLIWYYPNSTPFGMPSQQTSVLYNVDGTASQASLVIGRPYHVFVSTMDAYLNTAWYGISDTPSTAGSSGGAGVINSGSITGHGGDSESYILDSGSVSVTGNSGINGVANSGSIGAVSTMGGLKGTISGSIQIYAH